MNKRPVIASLALLLVVSCASSRSSLSNTAPARSASTGSAWTSRLIDPVSAPTAFESPIINTSLNALIIHQKLPSSSIFAGGDLQVYALQARYAITDRLAFIATKDGYIDFNPDATMDDEGTADIAAGFKYAVIDDPEAGLLVTPGFVFETKSGDKEVFQGNGDGLIRPFVSTGWDGGDLNFIGSFAYNHPLDDDAESSSYDYHLHLDYELAPSFFPLVEINGITYTSDGSALAANFEGGDLINLGSTNVAGNSLITGAVGSRYKVCEGFFLGFTYEWPLTSREDLIDSRFTFDALILL